MADPTTHWDGCEREHHACALARLDALRTRLAAAESRYETLALGIGYAEQPMGRHGVQAAEPATIIAAWKEMEARLAQVEGERDRMLDGAVLRADLDREQSMAFDAAGVPTTDAQGRGLARVERTRLLVAERDAAQARATQAEAERDRSHECVRKLADVGAAHYAELVRTRAARDAAEAHVARLVGAGEQMVAALDQVMAMPRVLDAARVRIGTAIMRFRAALTAPDLAALVARERARGAVVEAAVAARDDLLGEIQGMNHDDPDCPVDDPRACACANISRVNAFFAALDALAPAPAATPATEDRTDG